MARMIEYLYDGASPATRAVLALLQGKGEIEGSWNDEYKCYDAKVEISRWENGREQGYVCYLRKWIDDRCEQLNIAFFEHRNSDSIHAVKWKQYSINGINIETADFGDIYKNKYDTSFLVGPFEHYKMADWIYDEFVKFWNEGRGNE